MERKDYSIFYIIILDMTAFHKYPNEVRYKPWLLWIYIDFTIFLSRRFFEIENILFVQDHFFSLSFTVSYTLRRSILRSQIDRWYSKLCLMMIPRQSNVILNLRFGVKACCSKARVGNNMGEIRLWNNRLDFL